MSNTEYPKVEKELFNVDNENLQKLASLFPSAVKDGQLDIEALKEELGQFEEVGQEKYELNWAGKQNAKKEARKNVLGKTLRYIEGDGVNEDTTQNLYIEGDNLEVLKLLRKNYYGSIKMIYIDPPYNTGNDFVYNDNFSISQEELEQIQGERDEYGERLQKNSKDSAKYHTNWLNMMYPRLQLAKDLLTDDGVIFISIDDNEQANLKQLCDGIFGTENFIAQITREAIKGGSQSKYIRITHDYVFAYAKNLNDIEFGGIEVEGIKLDLKDEKGAYARGRELNKWGAGSRREDSPSMWFPITGPNGEDVYPIRNDGSEGRWRLGKERMYKIVKDGDVIFEKRDNGTYIVYEKIRDDSNRIKQFISILKDDYINAKGTESIKKLFNIERSYFDYAKPVNLIQDLLKMSNSMEDDIILDFFSGSATTAHAVMQLNSEDNGNRRFILVQLPEVTDENSEARIAGFDNICEIGKERIRRAGQKIKDEIENGNQQLKLGEEPKKVPDIGFKVFRVGETTLNWEKLSLLGKDLAHDYLPNTSNKDRLDFTPDYQNDLNVVYEIMLRQEGLPLTSNIEKLTDIGSRTYLVADSYLISLEETITPEMIEKLSALNPLPFKFVFRDSAFDDDIVFKDETFRKLNALIDKNTNSEKKAYTVEFI
jgi:adenine-specific DNA-methyltransferase